MMRLFASRLTVISLTLMGFIAPTKSLAQTPSSTTVTSTDGRFRWHCHRGELEHLADFAFQTLAEAARIITETIKIPLPPIADIEIHDTLAALSKASDIPLKLAQAGQVTGITRQNRIHVLSPSAVKGGYPWIDTLVHEYMHLVLVYTTEDRLPIWVQEGTAKHIEHVWHPSDASIPLLTPTQKLFLSQALASDRLIALDQIENSFAALPDSRAITLAFAQSSSLITFIISELPKQTFGAFLQSVRHPQSFWTTLSKLTHVPRNQWIEKWKSYAKSTHIKEVSPPPTRLNNPQPYLRIADLLRQKQRLVAAQREYELAKKQSGDTNVDIATGLADVLIQQKQAQQALAVLGKAQPFATESAQFHMTLAKALLALNKTDPALVALNRALQIDPFSKDLHCLFLRVLPQGEVFNRHQHLCKIF